MKVSVIIPAYNHEKYIGETISSVLDQTHRNIELIIINDGSSDRTEDEINRFADPRIKYIRQENSGAHNAINCGIDIAEGEFISILNSDDIYHSSRIEKCLNFLIENKKYSVVVTQVEGIDDYSDPVDLNNPHIAAWHEWYNIALQAYRQDNFLLNAFARNILITTSNFFIRREVLHQIGGFRALRYAHDWDMLLRLAKASNIYLMNDVLLKYRIHQSNTIHENDAEARVKLEVNWLIADNVVNLSSKYDTLDLLGSLKQNHYINYQVFCLLLMMKNEQDKSLLLDFDSSASRKVIALLK